MSRIGGAGTSCGSQRLRCFSAFRFTFSWCCDCKQTVKVDANGLAGHVLRHMDVFASCTIVPERPKLAAKARLTPSAKLVYRDPLRPRANEYEMDARTLDRRLSKGKARRVVLGPSRYTARRSAI
jgi:hypothetical protein